MEHCNDFRYDLKVGQGKENELAEIMASKTVEVKYDLQGCRTGNIYVEFRSRGKWSGICTTQATHWCYALNGDCEGEMILVETAKIKQKVKALHSKGKIIKGGDNNTSEGVLIPLGEFFNINDRWNTTTTI